MYTALQGYANELANAESDEQLAQLVQAILEREGVTQGGAVPGSRSVQRTALARRMAATLALSLAVWQGRACAVLPDATLQLQKASPSFHLLQAQAL